MKRYRPFLAGSSFALLLAFYALLPGQFFTVPYSTVTYDCNGIVTGARVAADGQWRFPQADSLPPLYEKALLSFEDGYFYAHIGINPVSMFRALKANIKARKVIQGGSTITMQLVRMALQNQPRTYLQKLKEILLAIRVEMRYSKKEILLMYAAHAPFGGNIVGLEAASWRYFGRSPFALSDAEYALLAILPNAPGTVRPGKNSLVLRQKRNRLLDKLFREEVLSPLDYELAKQESIPEQTLPLPDLAPHLTEKFLISHTGQKCKTTIDISVQAQTGRILQRFHQQLAANGVHNLALIVAKTETGEVVAYHGNTKAGAKHGEYVDIIQSSRSSGSILKPFLYGAMQQKGLLLPDEFVVDIPTFIAGFNPENYARSYEGLVPASEALARSLNVPAVRELRQFGVSAFKIELQRLGFSTVNRGADNYGLSLIIGGAEVTLWDACNAYLTLGKRVLAANQKIKPSRLHVLQSDTLSSIADYDAGAAFITLSALKMHDDAFAGDATMKGYVHKISWKTGTSYGYRDAWAIGVTPKYTIGVWVGNADGEGRPGVVGAEAAAPIMFEIFDALNETGEPFLPPYNHLKEVYVCATSGLLATRFCTEQKQQWVAYGVENAKTCHYHEAKMLTPDGRYSVEKSCAKPDDLRVNWFNIPPACAYYYVQKHPNYAPLPPLAPYCSGNDEQNPMQLIYPSNFQKLVRTKQLDGSKGVVVFKLAHNHPEKKVYWHANGIFLGETTGVHDLPVMLQKGAYVLHVVDEDGNELRQNFTMFN